MAGTYVYIDGLNFYYGAIRGTSYKWFDLEAWVRTLLPRDNIGLIQYFTAPVRQQYPGDRAHERQNVLLRALSANPLISVHEGHFTTEAKWRPLADHKFGLRDLFRPVLRPSPIVRAIFAEARRRRYEAWTLARVMVDEEKRSDVSLAAHLVYDSVTNACDKAVVVTNDSDLMEPLILAAQTGIQVGLVNPHRSPTNRRLKGVAAFEIPFRREALAKCLLPMTVRARNGRQLHCPNEWRP